MEEISVLDKGVVRLVEFMGGDEGVVLAARVSMAGGLKGEEKDKKLIHYLLQHSHLTPFEHAVFKFYIKTPLFIARQWFRHRWGSYNEISGRYVEVKDEFYIPEKFRTQDTENKQGSLAAPELDQDSLRAAYEAAIRQGYSAYQGFLSGGVAREMARMLLPLSLYTEFYWTVNCRSLMNFVSLRADRSAQWEIQRYAEALADIFRRRMPWSWEAFLKCVWKGENEAFRKEDYVQRSAG